MEGRASDREDELARAVENGAPIPFLIRLAAERCRSDQWPSAARLYDLAIARGTVPYEVWMQAAVAHLEIDDQAGYQFVCGAMRARHRAALPERWVAKSLADVCLLGSAGVGDDGKARTWVENIVAGLPPDRNEWRHELLSTLTPPLLSLRWWRRTPSSPLRGLTCDSSACPRFVGVWRFD